VRQLLAVSPENRFASAADLMAALDEQSAPVLVVRAGPASVDAMTPPVVVRTARESLWRTLAEPRGLLRHVTRRQLVIAAIALAAFVIIIAMLAAGGSSPAPGPSPAGTGSGAVVVPTSTSSTSEPVASGDIPPFANLPPPPAPSSSSAPARGRKTGPGGVYIPPPSQWFK
jgi:hypothetical protein